MKLIIFAFVSLFSLSSMAFSDIDLIEGCSDNISVNAFGYMQGSDLSDCVEAKLKDILVNSELVSLEKLTLETKLTLSKAIHMKKAEGGHYTSPDGEYGSVTKLKAAYTSNTDLFVLYEKSGGEWSRQFVTYFVFKIDSNGTLVDSFKDTVSLR